MSDMSHIALPLAQDAKHPYRLNDADGLHVATFHAGRRGESGPTARAVAVAVNAFPSLLAACEALVAYQESTDLDDEPEDGEYGDGKRALLAARAAIALAKPEAEL